LAALRRHSRIAAAKTELIGSCGRWPTRSNRSSSDPPDQNVSSKLVAACCSRRRRKLLSKMTAEQQQHHHFDDAVGLQEQFEHGEVLGHGTG
jgi:hypothetical protein